MISFLWFLFYSITLKPSILFMNDMNPFLRNIGTCNMPRFNHLLVYDEFIIQTMCLPTPVHSFIWLKLNLRSLAVVWRSPTNTGEFSHASESPEARFFHSLKCWTMAITGNVNIYYVKALDTMSARSSFQHTNIHSAVHQATCRYFISPPQPSCCHQWSVDII